MKTLLTGLFAAVALSVASAAAADTKIGFVNTERILKEAPISIQAQKKLEKEFSGRELALQKLAKQAQDLQSQLDKNGASMPEAERRAKEQTLANLNRDLQRQSREFREDLNLRRNEELSLIQEKARQAILNIAKQGRYDLIVEQAVYVNPKDDITNQVLKALGAPVAGN